MNYMSNSTTTKAHDVPGKAVGISAFAVSFVVPVVGVILGIIARAQSRRAGMPNNWAVAGIGVGIAILVAAGITSVTIWG